jgi:hypothetical protein
VIATGRGEMGVVVARVAPDGAWTVDVVAAVGR